MDLKYTLNIFNLYPDEKDIELMVRGYSSDNNKSKLSFFDFCMLFVPIDEKCEKRLKMRYQNCNFDTKLNKYDIFVEETTKNMFLDLMNEIISIEKKLENWRTRLNNLKAFNVRELFNRLDRYQKNYIIAEDVMFYFKKHGIDSSERSLDLIFRKFDKDKDGRLTYHEFADEVFPKSKEFLFL